MSSPGNIPQATVQGLSSPGGTPQVMLHARTVSATKEWILNLDEGYKEKLIDMVTQAVNHYGGQVTTEAKRDIATKFQLNPRQVEEAIAWCKGEDLIETLSPFHESLVITDEGSRILQESLHTAVDKAIIDCVAKHIRDEMPSQDGNPDHKCSTLLKRGYTKEAAISYFMHYNKASIGLMIRNATAQSGARFRDDTYFQEQILEAKFPTPSGRARGELQHNGIRTSEVTGASAVGKAYLFKYNGNLHNVWVTKNLKKGTVIQQPRPS